MGSRTQLPRVSCVFRYDPYQTEDAIVMQEEVFALPADTIHTQLANSVSYMPYPDEEFFAPPPTLRKEQMVRLFIGQLPYHVTDMQLQWLCSTFGNGVTVYFPERIVKHSDTNTTSSSSSSSKGSKSSGGKVPTGCIHAYCRPEQAEALMDGLHKRLLIDDTGVWYAQNDTELEAVCAHTAVMKKERSKRPHNRPYDTVVCQLATSTYVPKPPRYCPTTTTTTTTTTACSSGSSSSSSATTSPRLPAYSSCPQSTQQPQQQQLLLFEPPRCAVPSYLPVQSRH